MPTTGNTLGPRRYYQYTSDSGENYKVLTDETLGAAMNGTLNDTNPDLPKRQYPRYVLARATVAGVQVTKRLIAFTIDNTSYAADGSTTIAIDTVNFKTTGRVGERKSFGANPT
jgi:hypothetical protein